MCAIQALGSFNPMLGGRPIPRENKKAVGFPPGSLVLVPSATITRSNTPIQQGEARTSFTQFCARTLFRCVDNGFRAEAALAEEDPVAYQLVCKAKDKCWQKGLSLRSCMGDLIKSADNSTSSTVAVRAPVEPL